MRYIYVMYDVYCFPCAAVRYGRVPKRSKSLDEQRVSTSEARMEQTEIENRQLAIYDIILTISLVVIAIINGVFGDSFNKNTHHWLAAILTDAKRTMFNAFMLFLLFLFCYYFLHFFSLQNQKPFDFLFLHACCFIIIIVIASHVSVSSFKCLHLL